LQSFLASRLLKIFKYEVKWRVPSFFLSDTWGSLFQIQAFWTLTNIASSNKAKFSVAMTEAGLVPVAVQAMKSSNRELAFVFVLFATKLIRGRTRD
jgi:hypothetical protein